MNLYLDIHRLRRDVGQRGRTAWMQSIMGSICSAVFILLAFAMSPRRDEPTAGLQPQVRPRSSHGRGRPAIANRKLAYSTFSNPVSMVTLVPMTLP